MSAERRVVRHYHEPSDCRYWDRIFPLGAIRVARSATQSGVSAEHAVYFYARTGDLADAVGSYLSDATLVGARMIVIATRAHRRAFADELAARRVQVSDAGNDGGVLVLDAEQTLAKLLVDGVLDAGAFDRVIGDLVRRTARAGAPVRIYGELVSLLWDAGNVLAAIELERCWNELAGEVPFALLCSYAAKSVSGPEYARALQEICQLHSSTLPTLDEADRGAHARGAAGSATEVLASFPAGHEAPGRARRMVISTLRERGYDDAIVNEAALALTELASNAVIHARSPFAVLVRSRARTLRVAVRDARPLLSGERYEGLIARPGHGLGVIEALATCWGVEELPDGKVVWAQFQVP